MTNMLSPYLIERESYNLDGDFAITGLKLRGAPLSRVCSGFLLFEIVREPRSCGEPLLLKALGLSLNTFSERLICKKVVRYQSLPKNMARRISAFFGQAVALSIII